MGVVDDSGVERVASKKDFTEVYRRDREKFQKLQKLKQYQMYKGSSYPPTIMDKWGHIRDRLGLGMTNEDRGLRKQFLADKQLAIDEPRYVPELRPRNFFRRLIAWPWDTFFNALKPILGDSAASWSRRLLPRLLLGAGIFYSGVYYITYRPANWTTKKGIYMFPVEKPKVHPNDPVVWRDPADHEFFDRGYRFRTALKDVSKTTSPTYLDAPHREQVTLFPEGDRVDYINPNSELYVERVLEDIAK